MVLLVLVSQYAVFVEYSAECVAVKKESWGLVLKKSVKFLSSLQDLSSHRHQEI